MHGEDAEPAEAAGAEFAAFCAEHRDEIADILRTRLVQTSAPGRGAGAPRPTSTPCRRCASASAVVVFHSMVTVHVPRERLPAFDAAIEALGARRRLLHVSLEGAKDVRGHLLRLEDSEGDAADLAHAEGHGRWIEPLG